MLETRPGESGACVMRSKGPNNIAERQIDVFHLKLIRVHPECGRILDLLYLSSSESAQASLILNS